MCVVFGFFNTKSLCNLLLMSCIKLLDDGIGQDTFGDKDGSEPCNQKDIKLQSVEEIQKLLGFCHL